MDDFMQWAQGRSGGGAMTVPKDVQAQRDADATRIKQEELANAQQVNPGQVPFLQKELGATPAPAADDFMQWAKTKDGPSLGNEARRAGQTTIGAPRTDRAVGGKFGVHKTIGGPDTGDKITDAYVQAPYNVGGRVTDFLAPHVPAPVAAGAGYLANVGTSLISAPPAVKGGAAAAEAAGAGAKALLPKAAPDVAALAQKAHEYGIPLRPDMLGNSKVMRIVGEALEQVPLAGSKADPRQAAFNSAIMKTIGAEGDKLTPDVFARAINKAGTGIGDISAKHPIPVTKLGPGLSQVAEAMRTETEQTRGIIHEYMRQLNELGTAAGEHPAGTINGEAFRKLRTKITGQMRRTSDGDLKNALSQLDDVMLDTIEGELTPIEAKQFATFRHQYANAKTLEPMVAKSPTGDLSPAGLMSRVTANSSGKAAMAKGKAGDLGELARIGQRFVKEPGSSNTAERSMAYSALGGSGLAGGWPAAAGLYGAANAYNRLGPRIARGMIPPPP